MTTFALTHPSVKRPIPGSTGIGYNTNAAQLIASNIHNGNIKRDGGAKLWRVERTGRRLKFIEHATVTVDGQIA